MRLRLLGGIIVLIALFIGFRLYFVQIVHGSDFALKAEHQYQSANASLFDRGSIYFTRKDGEVLSAAGVATGFRLAIDPEHLKNPQSVFTTLSSLTPIDETAFMASAAKTTDPYEVISLRLSESVGNAIAAKDIPGVTLERERWRTYPGGESAAQTIGFIAFDNDNTLMGRYGLERYYNDVLDRSHTSLFGNFFAELFGNINSLAGDGRGEAGDVITTIEPVAEEKLMQVLADVESQYSSKETGGIIMNPKTGEIIALGSVPSFDVNTFSQADPNTFGNPLVEHQYEFGSIMKSLTMTSGLDAGVITPQTTYNDTGCVTLNTKKICNYDLKPRGPNTPMQEILSQSLNLGATFVSQKLGHEKFRSYFTALGFGTETGIDLPSEARGDIQNIKDSPRDIEYATASYGQGIAETPVQMIKALGALANGGKTVTPHVVRAIRLESGVEKKLAWGEPKTVFSPGAVEMTTRMLVKVVDTKLANGTVTIPSMSVAAKTGTAQIAGPGGKYAPGLYFHSFFGYFPAYDPTFIILLYTREPKGVQYASETLTHPFMNLVHFLINYYEVPPDRAPLSS